MAPPRRALTQPGPIDRSARNLLFDLPDRPDPVLSPVAFADYFSTAGRHLLDAGLIVAEGHEAIAISDDHDDAPVSLIWSAEHGRHGHFSATAGWISVDPAAISRYRVNIETVLAMSLGGLKSQAAVRPVVDTLVWDAGDVRLPHRTQRTPLWFARCVGDPRAWRDIRALLISRPTARARMILSPTSHERFPRDVPTRNTLVSLRDVMDGEGGLALDPIVLAAALSGPPAHLKPDEPLAIAGEGSQVRFLGQVFHMRGDTQRRIVAFLERRYREGQSMVRVAAVIEELGLRDDARIRDYFRRESGRRVMNELLFESDGNCGFRLPGTG